MSYHLGEHYNSVRLASDPCDDRSPAIDFPIGHELKEIEGLSDAEETKADSKMKLAMQPS